MPVLSKAQQYEATEPLFAKLAERADEVLGVKPFRWQLEAAVAILSGRDVVVDVGTGAGKSLCFTLPLLLNKQDISITVSPLTALMIDQANMSPISSIAVCKETLSQFGAANVYKDIVNGKFQQIFVSPEIATSSVFQSEVLSKSAFSSRVRAVNVDEAHCITLWGGTFRKDYLNLGILRGRFAKNVPFLVASATLPDHVFEDIRVKLKLQPNVKKVQLTNARPNIALSVRTMKQTEDSKADLRFLIPPSAKRAADIPITLVFCNSRPETEDCVDRLRDWAADAGIDRDSIVFYHSTIGERRKREIEERLRKGEVRIVVCTDAVGMGCDLRNIERVILWRLPPSFCSLVQRVGRAGRDLEKNAEAILIIPVSVLKDGVSAEEVSEALVDATLSGEGENDSNGVDPQEMQQRLSMLDQQGMELPDLEDSDDEEENSGVTIVNVGERTRRQKASKETNVAEANALTEFVTTKECRRLVWDRFFKNESKDKHTHTRPYPRCCDNCEPRLFLVEEIEVPKVQGLKRGKKQGFSAKESEIMVQLLKDWRETTLLDAIYPGVETFSGATILGDDVIEKLANSGEFIRDYAHLRRHVRWAYGEADVGGEPSTAAKMLLEKLPIVYEEVKAERGRQEREDYQKNLQKFHNTTPATFNEDFKINFVISKPLPPSKPYKSLTFTEVTFDYT